ncbi:hypothetical protein CR513_08867, partial [Mucuna pruriens]
MTSTWVLVSYVGVDIISINFHFIQRCKIIRVLCKTMVLWSWLSLCTSLFRRIKTQLLHSYKCGRSITINLVFVFKCKWVDSNTVDLNKVSYKGESFIMTSHAKQVDNCFQKKSMRRSDENQDISLDLTNTPSFSTHIPTFNDENEVDDVHVTRFDYIESLLEILLFDQVTEMGDPSNGTFGTSKST